MNMEQRAKNWFLEKSGGILGGGLPKSLRNFFAGKHWADFGHLAEKFCQIVFEELAVENLHSRHRRYLRSCMWFSYCVEKKNKNNFFSYSQSHYRLKSILSHIVYLTVTCASCSDPWRPATPDEGGDSWPWSCRCFFYIEILEKWNFKDKNGIWTLKIIRKFES